MSSKQKIEVYVNDIQLDIAIRTYDHWRNRRLNSGKLEEEAKGELLKALEGHHKEHNADVYYTSGNVSVTLVNYAGQPRISGSSLLAQNVRPEAIAVATNRSPYTVYTPRVEHPLSLIHISEPTRPY